MKAIRYILLLVLVVFVGYTFYIIWKQSQPVPTQYTLNTASIQDIDDEITISGELVSRNEGKIYAGTTGQISRLYVKVGDYVHKGDIIANITPTTDQNLITNARNGVKDASLAVEQQQKETERARARFNDGDITQQELSQQEYLLNKAQQNLVDAEASLKVAQRGYAEDSKNTTEVRSTVNGYILSLPMKENDYVYGPVSAQATVIAKVGDLHDIMFKGMVDESQVGRLVCGQQVRLIVAALPKDTLTATLDFISPEGQDVNSIRQFEVHASIEAKETCTLRSGFSANAFVTVAHQMNAITIPESSIVNEDGKTYAYKLISADKDGKHQQFQRIEVNIGISNGILVEVKSGIKKGDILRGNPINE